ncbi:MAG: 3-oxoacyl-[acyl-carrier-protein] reductase [Epulopiscium sp. Nele67-Bin004]|nr:MAG: 3-oxoacyl-[acyl-carrier-protein] reductase [Epulopiscium sp. Nele67-Bin004]
MLTGKTAVITGSSRGIGKAIAIMYAQNGANVVINHSSESGKDTAQAVADEIVAMGREAIVVQANVANFDEAKTLIDEAINHFGKIDILVNNAGITRDMLLLRMTEEEFDQVIDVNLKGVFNCIKHAVRPMMKSGGSIINLSSVVGLTGNAGQVNYAAAKAGIIGVTKSVAREFAKKNIRTNAIVPGYIETEMTDVLGDKVKEKVMQNIPMQKLGTVEDVAGAALFLASDLSKYITGETIRVDGGMVM